VRAFGACALAAVVLAAPLSAQETKAEAPADQAAPPPWESSASVYAYFVPHDIDYASETIIAEREGLHLEARYNYEDQSTASLWMGRKFEFGESLKGEVTPMIGFVFGHTNGIAPGYHFTLDYKKLELYSEGEYLFDADVHSDSFFYTWSELTYRPLDWLQAGLVTQRTRAYQTPLNIQRGLLLRASYKSWAFGVYIFDFGWTDPTVVTSVTLEF